MIELWSVVGVDLAWFIGGNTIVSLCIWGYTPRGAQPHIRNGLIVEGGISLVSVSHIEKFDEKCLSDDS